MQTIQEMKLQLIDMDIDVIEDVVQKQFNIVEDDNQDYYIYNGQEYQTITDIINDNVEVLQYSINTYNNLIEFVDYTNKMTDNSYTVSDIANDSEMFYSWYEML
jgi:hypothetical protein